MSEFKLGLTDPRPGAIPLRAASYINWREMPTPPSNIGHWRLIPDNAWGVLGNNLWGCCAEAGACHMSMLFTKEGSDVAAPFSTSTCLRNYTEITQFDPDAGPSGDNPTDNGTDMGVLAQHWIDKGIVDDNGKRHQLVATLDLNPGDLRELWLCEWLFTAVAMGFALPGTAQQQSADGQVWDVVPGASIEGGHFVPGFGRLGNGVGVTWGLVQPFTPRFYQTYNNQGFVGLSEEMLISARSIDGFDDATLRDDIVELGKDLARLPEPHQFPPDPYPEPNPFHGFKPDPYPEA